jgi:hypothetical protein
MTPLTLGISHYFVYIQRKWYFPRLGKPNAPSLSKVSYTHTHTSRRRFIHFSRSPLSSLVLAQAWAYYEHITLPRHFVGENTAEHVMRLAEPGEKEDTELYSPIRTPQSSLIEWGIGLDLYFSVSP